MKTIKVSEATDIQLDWLVAKALGLNVYIPAYADSPWLMARSGSFAYSCSDFSTDWADGGPIIEQEGITVVKLNDLYFPKGNEAGLHWGALYKATTQVVTHYGTTPLIAAMRCFSASKLGEEVEVPDELVCMYVEPMGK